MFIVKARTAALVLGAAFFAAVLPASGKEQPPAEPAKEERVQIGTHRCAKACLFEDGSCDFGISTLGRKDQRSIV